MVTVNSTIIMYPNCSESMQYFIQKSYNRQHVHFTWWCEMDNQATTTYSYCPSSVSFPVWPHWANARQNRCQEDLKSFQPLENWSRPPGRPCTMWMKTIQQDLKSNNLSLNKAIDVCYGPKYEGTRRLRLPVVRENSFLDILGMIYVWCLETVYFVILFQLKCS